MAANAQAICTSFKQDLLNGLHAFGASVIRAATTKDTFNAALYLINGSIGAATSAYSATGEVANSGTYSAGGQALTNATAPTTSGTTAFWTPSANLTWTGFTSAAFDCMLLYNATAAGKNAVAAYTFGSQSVTSGTFTLSMPVNASGTALIQLN
ncbi:MAG: hypothetical protein ACRD3Q_00350 [Terriglobales bacterium]